MAIYKEDIVSIDLNAGTIHRSFLNHSIGTGDDDADHFGVLVYREKEPVDLTGVTVEGFFMPPQGDPIAITTGNIVSGNKAVVVLPQACYNYEGQFTLAIKLVSVSQGITGTVRIVDGMVDNTHTGGAVAPTESVPTYQEIIAQYEDMVAATEAAATAAEDAEEKIEEMSNVITAVETNRITTEFVQKGWVNGTGYVANDGVMSPGVVLRNEYYDTIISTDFSLYTISLYYFSSATNKYPTFKGNMRIPFIVPKNQYYGIDVRYKAGVSTLDAYDVANIPVVTKLDNSIGVWNAIETNILDETALVLKAWENGTGFISDDRTMGPGKVLMNPYTNTRLITDFDRYTIQVYYFSSPSNLWPHFEGNMRKEFNVPAGQYFTYFIRNRAALQTLTDYDKMTIPQVTKCLTDVGIWNRVEEVNKNAEDRFLAVNKKYPFNSVYMDYTTETQIQDAVAFDGHMYQFTSGGEDIGDYAGAIMIIDIPNKTVYGGVYHDLGHAACLSYNKAKDTLAAGRMDDGTPTIHLYGGFSEAIVEGATLRPSDANCVNISLDASLLIGRTSFDVFYGESEKILYAYCTRISTYYNNVVLYKILLGTGSTDLSGETGGYGTLISGKAEGEYNGTCQVLKQWYLPYVNRQPQTLKWIKGSLYMLTSNNDTILHKYKFIDDEFYEENNLIINDLNADGSVVSMEGESLCQCDGVTYIGLWKKTSPTKMRILEADI